MSQQFRACHAARIDGWVQGSCTNSARSGTAGLLDPRRSEPTFIWGCKKIFFSPLIFFFGSAVSLTFLTTTRQIAATVRRSNVPDQVHGRSRGCRIRDTWTSTQRGRQEGSIRCRLVLTFVDGRFIALGHGQVARFFKGPVPAARSSARSFPIDLPKASFCNFAIRRRRA